MNVTSETTESAETTTEQTTEDTAEAETKPVKDGGRTFTQADLDRIVEQRLAKERSKYADYEHLKATAGELDEIREALESEKTASQKALERAEAAEKRIVQAEQSALRTRVAALKGVPEEGLTGSTEEELLASAEKLIEWRDAHSKAGPPKMSGLKSGASGMENATPDPKTVAAQALSLLYKSG